jgi:hypothetical protein
VSPGTQYLVITKWIKIVINRNNELLARSGTYMKTIKKLVVIMIGALSVSGCLVQNDEGSNNPSPASSLSFSGVTGVLSVTPTSATFTFTEPTPVDQAKELRLYCGSRGATPTLVLSGISVNVTSVSLTGLNSGTTYTCKIAAVDTSGAEQTNPATVSFQTTSTMGTAYKGVSLVQAYGDSPSAPVGTPQAKQVIVTWQPFTGAAAGTTYKLFRVAKGGTIDITQTGACTPTTTTTCLVCSPTGTGAKTCNDINVAASPAQYDYVVTWVVNGNIEELPSTTQPSYRVTVQVPPANMVLVHRDAANYEMCNFMGKTTDPLNHQRCVYTGLGATPYNANPGAAALNLPAGYYDFGYNLFIDRWTAACNWTPQSSGGKCGAGATPGNCYGSLGENYNLLPPSNSIGADGNVYYDAKDGGCWIKVSGAWKADNDASLTKAQRFAIYTITPSAATPKPPITSVNQPRANDICAAATDADYGAKRLLRRREYIAAAAWPWLPDDPATVISNKGSPWAQISTLEYDTAANHLTTNGGCNTNSATGLTCNFPTGDCAGDNSGDIQDVVIGSVSTKNCVSRFGAQDMVGNVNQWVSDQIDECNAGGVIPAWESHQTSIAETVT